MKRRADADADDNKDEAVAPLPELKKARRGGSGEEGGCGVAGVVRGLEEVLCVDVLAAVCRQVGSTADLVRLSCVSRTLRQLVASDSLWRHRYRQERGQAAHDALALALQLHGSAALMSFFALARLPPPHVPRHRDPYAAPDDDDADADADTAGAGAEKCGFGVWFEALVATDKPLQWRRWMAAVSRATRDDAMRWMESEVRVASQRKQFAKRIRQWLGDAADDEADSEHQDEGGIVFRMRRRHSDDDDNDDDEYDDNGKLKPPKLETELQRTQVRALLCMTRLNDHFDHNCSDDYRGGDGQYSVSTTKVFFIPPEKRQPVAHPMRSIRFSPRGKGQLWEYSVNTARDDNPDLSEFPEFFAQLRRQLLHSHKKDAPSGEDDADDEDNVEGALTLHQFLYFVGVALDLGDKDDNGVGYTPLHSLISQ